MKPLLITASLLGSWRYAFEAWEDREAEALEELAKTIRREPLTDNEAMKAGRVFENRVRIETTQDRSWLTESDIKDLLESPDPMEGDYLACVQDVAAEVRGGTWQVKLSRVEVIAGQQFLLYGRLDVLKGPEVIDLKFTRSFEVGKYRDAPQTKMYLYLAEKCLRMRYLISDGRETYEDVYNRADVAPIQSEVAEFWSWLQTKPELLATYIEKWQSK